jgi:hypothetical protein
LTVKRRLRLKGSLNYKHLRASSKAYTALCVKLTTFNTVNITSSSFTSKGHINIKGKAGVTNVAVAKGPLANGDIYLISTAALGDIRKASTFNLTSPTMPADKTIRLLNKNKVRAR